MSHYKKTGFTLIELLTVIAIIGILAGILIPTVGAVRISANKSKTKVQFSQWAVAMQLFKTEYGYYPNVTASATSSSGPLDPTSFFANLTAKDYAGNSLSGASLKGNTKALSFYSVAGTELVAAADGTVKNEIMDAFGNSTIIVMVDADGSGIITGAERITTYIPGGNSVDGATSVVTPQTGIDTADIRAGVAFYSAGKNSSINDYVYSWK